MGFIKKWLFSVVLKRTVVSLAKAVASFAVTHGISLVANYKGYTINLQNQAAIAALLIAGIKPLEHWAAAKFPCMAFLNGIDNAPDAPAPGAAAAPAAKP